MNTEELKKIIEELTSLGEDQQELSTILELFPTLDEEGQITLYESLKKERDTLKNL